MISKEYINQCLFVAVIIAALCSFIQDFVYFDYSRSPVIFTEDEQSKLNNMLYRDVIKHITERTKHYSVSDSIIEIFSRYRYLYTWQFNLRTFIIYF